MTKFAIFQTLLYTFIAAAIVFPVVMCFLVDPYGALALTAALLVFYPVAGWLGSKL